MIFTLIIATLWYLSGLLSLAWAVKFNRYKIWEQLGLFLAGGLFGALIAGLLFLDHWVEKVEKMEKFEKKS
jgi:uncharacterized membrane protein YbhN (UPF0104 family)